MLDTTLLIDVARAPPRMKQILVDLGGLEQDLVVPAQAAIEFASGEKDPAAALQGLRDAFTLAVVDEALMLEPARLAMDALAAGRFPRWADIQITATAKRLGMAVATRDVEHFEALGLAVLPYQA